MRIDGGVAAIVTGGASGLGLATVRALAEAGARVAVFDRSVEAGERAAAEIGGTFCEVDVTSDASVEAGFARARAAHGQERICVNCAGVGNAAKTAGRKRDTGEIAAFPMAQFEFVIQVNLIGTFRVMSRSAAGMLTLDPVEGERGVIVNTASIAAQDGQMGQAAYSASKGGVVALTLPVARDLSGEGIRVNAIMPGVFETPLLMAAGEKVVEALGQSVPFPKRLGRPPEYAALVLEMVRNGYFNGEAVRLDGAIRRQLQGRPQVLVHLAGVEGAPVVGGLRAAAHDDLGGGVVLGHLTDVEVVEASEAAAEAAVSAIAAVAVAPAAAGAAVQAPVGAEHAAAEAAVAVGPVAQAVSIVAVLALGVAVDGGEPVEAVLQRDLGGAEQEVALHPLPRGQGVAAEADAEAVGLDPLVVEAARGVGVAHAQGLVGGRGLAGAQRQGAGRRGQEKQALHDGRYSEVSRSSP